MLPALRILLLTISVKIHSTPLRLVILTPPRFPSLEKSNDWGLGACCLLRLGVHWNRLDYSAVRRGCRLSGGGGGSLAPQASQPGGRSLRQARERVKRNSSVELRADLWYLSYICPRQKHSLIHSLYWFHTSFTIQMPPFPRRIIGASNFQSPKKSPDNLASMHQCDTDLLWKVAHTANHETNAT